MEGKTTNSTHRVSTEPFSLWEKDGTRGFTAIFLHPNPLPEGEGNNKVDYLTVESARIKVRSLALSPARVMTGMQTLETLTRDVGINLGR